MAAAVDAFCDARLLTRNVDSIEITHEALITAWPRLHGWISANRAGLVIHRRVTIAARLWAGFRPRRGPPAAGRSAGQLAGVGTPRGRQHPAEPAGAGVPGRQRDLQRSARVSSASVSTARGAGSALFAFVLACSVPCWRWRRPAPTSTPAATGPTPRPLATRPVRGRLRSKPRSSGPRTRRCPASWRWRRTGSHRRSRPAPHCWMRRRSGRRPGSSAIPARSRPAAVPHSAAARDGRRRRSGAGCSRRRSRPRNQSASFAAAPRPTRPVRARLERRRPVAGRRRQVRTDGVGRRRPGGSAAGPDAAAGRDDVRAGLRAAQPRPAGRNVRRARRRAGGTPPGRGRARWSMASPKASRRSRSRPTAVSWPWPGPRTGWRSGDSTTPVRRLAAADRTGSARCRTDAASASPSARTVSEVAVGTVER